MTTLSGKTALVTGASRGIGRASALALARMGAQVLVHYSSGVKEAEAVVAEIRKAGGRADAVGADLSAPDGAHKLARQVRAVVGDRLDILVANAGISRSATIEETTVEDFDRLFAVNVRAPFFLVQQLLPIHGSGDSVVLVSSLVAHAVVGTLSAYAATKGAIDTLVKHFASVLGERGVRVNAVAPGVLSRPPCRASPRQTSGAMRRWACRRSSASRNRTTSAVSSRSSLPTMRAGSRVTPSESMAARSSDAEGSRLVRGAWNRDDAGRDERSV